MTDYRIRCNVTNMKDLVRVRKQLKQDMERRKKIVDRFITIYAKRSVRVVREQIALKRPKYNSALTASVSWRVTGKRAEIWMEDPYGTGAIYFEYGTGPAGRKGKHPEHEAAGWDYGPAWFTQADGKDMKSMYGWRPSKDKDTGKLYYFTAGQPSHPFWYNACKIISDDDFIDACWEEAKKRA